MSNAINKLQCERLLSIMVQNSNVAFGYHISIKDQYEKCWNYIEEELNSLGPPFKSLSEWKKTWSDQKRYILKKKDRANLTPIESAIYKMFSKGTRRSITQLEPEENEEINTDLKRLNESSPTKRIKLEVEENDTVAYDNNLFNITVLNEAEISDTGEENSLAGSRQHGEIIHNVELENKTLGRGSYLSTIHNTTKKVGTMKGKGDVLPTVKDMGQQDIKTALKGIGNCLEKLYAVETDKLKELKRHHGIIEKLRRQEMQLMFKRKLKKD